MDTLEEFKKQHLNNYRKVIIENMQNNTQVLFEEDILSLLKKPPLDSMDVIKTKILDIAKKNKTILNIEELEKILSNYRKEMIHFCKNLKKIRMNYLEQKIESLFQTQEGEIKLTRKDFTSINKQIKKELKEKLKLTIQKKIVNNVNNMFTDNIAEEAKKKITNDFVKFISGPYQRQLLENIDFKILVKDTTLMNGIKEQTDHYLFTLENSRLFQTTEK